MITNATITRIDAPSAPDTGGQVTFTPGAAISVRCAVDAVSRSQRWDLGAVIQESQAVLYVLRAALGALPLEQGYRVSYTLDGEAAVVQTVVHKRPRIKAGGLEHYELFLAAIGA